MATAILDKALVYVNTQVTLAFEAFLTRTIVTSREVGTERILSARILLTLINIFTVGTRSRVSFLTRALPRPDRVGALSVFVAVVRLQFTLINIITRLPVPGVPFVTRTRERAIRVETRGLRVTRSVHLTLIDIDARDTVPTPPLRTGAGEVADAVGTDTIFLIAIISLSSTLVHILAMRSVPTVPRQAVTTKRAVLICAVCVVVAVMTCVQALVHIPAVSAVTSEPAYTAAGETAYCVGAGGIAVTVV